MNKRLKLNHIHEQRSGRTRARIKLAGGRPRLTVFRSNTGLYAQVIDDVNGKTLVAVSSKDVPAAEAKKPKTDKSAVLGQIIAEKAVKAGVKEVVFDRGSYAYHGRVKAFAEGARKGGLQF